MTITAEDLVHREVLACVSHLVSTLAEGMNYVLPRRGEPFTELAEQALELASPIDDWKEAAEQAGWSLETSAAGHAVFVVTQEPDVGLEVEADGASPDWQALCEDNAIEPYQWDVFEHWIVSDWLAGKLEAHGEKVDRDFAGLTVWARTTTGQAIAMDSVIERIHAELIAAT